MLFTNLIFGFIIEISRNSILLDVQGGEHINGFEFCRKRAGFNSQIEAAVAIGVTQGTISQWENGLTHPTGDRLRFVAEVYGSTIDELMQKEVKSA